VSRTESLTKPDFSPHFIEGIEHFNAERFWEAHESWEQLWLAAESDVEQFLQGLIQVAAAYHHVKRGTYSGAIRLFDAGLRRLSAFETLFCDLDRGPVEEASRAQRAALLSGALSAPKNYPKLVLISAAPKPSREPW
jgi:uncharacterized protein